MSAATAAHAVPGLDRREAARLARVEYQRLVTLLRECAPEQWCAPTDCPEWTVRDMAAHVLGALEASASVTEQIHQMRAARRIDRPLVDALGVVQIADRTELDPQTLVERLASTIDRGVAGRSRVPSIARMLPIRFEMPYGTERVRLGFLLDTILLRDVWMHRVDIARATGAPLVLTADHDGRIVADVVGDWARRHDQPFRLVLDGPAGGVFAHGDVDDELRLDAVEFCRIVAGRAPGAGLLETEVVF